MVRGKVAMCCTFIVLIEGTGAARANDLGCAQFRTLRPLLTQAINVVETSALFEDRFYDEVVLTKVFCARTITLDTSTSPVQAKMALLSDFDSARLSRADASALKLAEFRLYTEYDRRGDVTSAGLVVILRSAGNSFDLEQSQRATKNRLTRAGPELPPHGRIYLPATGPHGNEAWVLNAKVGAHLLTGRFEFQFDGSLGTMTMRWNK